jgi:hypothetical protein
MFRRSLGKKVSGKLISLSHRGIDSSVDRVIGSLKTLQLVSFHEEGRLAKKAGSLPKALGGMGSSVDHIAVAGPWQGHRESPHYRSARNKLVFEAMGNGTV